MPTRTARKVTSKTGKGRINPAAEPRLSRTRRPPEIDVADWQAALRRQFGREQHFGLQNLGADPVFSDFRVQNPASGSRYRVAIRGRALGQNFCTCPDFATNDLGTCKHIEFTLAKLEAKRGGKAALAQLRLATTRRASQSRAAHSGAVTVAAAGTRDFGHGCSVVGRRVRADRYRAAVLAPALRAGQDNRWATK
jgi:hypothetical protein